MIFAEASNEFYGQFVIVALGIVGGLGGLAAIASYFATRREMENIERRVSTVEAELKEDRHHNQLHASERSKTLFTEIKTTREKLEQSLDDQTEKLEKRINRLSIGVAALCARQGVKFPSEDGE